MRQSLTFVPVLLALACGGCGGSKDAKLAPFTGQVVYNGRPVANATLTFQPEKGAIGTAITDNDGKFVAKTGNSEGVPIGKCTITVEAWAAAPGGDSGSQISEDKSDPKAYADRMKNAMMNQKKRVRPKSLVPLKYTKPDSTPLKGIEVPSSGNENFEIKLTD